MPITVEGALTSDFTLKDGQVTQDGDLSFKVDAFNLEINSFKQRFDGIANKTVPANGVTYVWIDSTGSLTTNNSGYPSEQHIRLGRVFSTGSVITSIRDDRSLLVAASTGSAGGVTDHGLLTGLGDDDHTQYLLRNVLTTKGDVFVRNSSEITRLPVGTNGQVLTADSGQTTGLIWSTVSGSGVSDHGLLTGLSDDDHLQYLHVSGARTMAGNLNMGGFNVSNVGTVDGVDVSTHGSRHNPGGADAVTTIAANSLLVGSVPAEGTSASLSRGDHTHGIPTGVPSSIGTTNQQGSSNLFPRLDHVHAHGNQGGGSQHANATTSVAGFMSSTDKTKLDGIATGAQSDHGQLTGLSDDDHLQYLHVSGTRGLSGTLSHNNNDIVQIKVASFQTEFANGNSGTSFTINWNNGQKQNITLNSTTTLSFTNPPGAGNFLLKLIQDSTGGRSVTWPASVRWPQGVAPAVNSGGGNAIHIITFYFDGTNYYAIGVLNFS